MDINEINIKEMFNHLNGKTSATKTIGIIGSLVALGGFFTSGNIIVYIIAFDKVPDASIINFMQTLVLQSIALFTISVGLLAVNKVKTNV